MNRSSADGKKRLMKNTVLLYALQFSGYAFGFVTIPYQSRVLGPVVAGTLGFAIAVMTYFQLFFDFGFLLSATADISRRQDDHEYLRKKVSSVTAIKLLIIIVCYAVLGGMCIAIPKFRDDCVLYFIYLTAYAVNSLIPDYLYRGLEQMGAITLRAVSVKLFSTIFIFVFLRTQNDYLVVPLLLLTGNLLALAGVWIHMRRVLGITLSRVSRKELWDDFKKSSIFFWSRIATTVYGATNTVIVGFMDKTGLSTGYYSSSDKLLTLAKNGMSPVADSMYPYMMKNRDFKLVKKVLFVLVPIIITGCVGIGIFAEPLCLFIFGAEFAGVAPVLILMLPAIAVILPSYILGFPTLGAMGLAKYANISVLVGTGVHIAGLLILLASANLSITTLAAMTSISEISIFLTRLIIVVKNRSLLRTGEV